MSSKNKPKPRERNQTLSELPVTLPESPNLLAVSPVDGSTLGKGYHLGVAPSQAILDSVITFLGSGIPTETFISHCYWEGTSLLFTLQGTSTYPTKREVRKIIGSKSVLGHVSSQEGIINVEISD